MGLFDLSISRISDVSLFITVFLTLCVAFVNGWTDAPNAISSCVVTRCISLKNAVILAAVCDFAGSAAVGIISGKVTETVINLADFGDNGLTALSGAMVSVVLWAVSAWYFGIPTSESHALLAGLFGAGAAVNGNFGSFDINEWIKVMLGLFLSVFAGFAGGYITSNITVRLFKYKDKANSDLFFRRSQLFAGALMAFMHGAQDSQKFAGILCLAIKLSDARNVNVSTLPILFVCSAVIALGTACGGSKIIKSVGMDMIKLRRDQGFSADISGAVCLFISTVLGLPVSTTHTKTSAILGVGASKSLKAVNWSVAGEMFAAWILTFPGCAILSYIVTQFFIRVIF